MGESPVSDKPKSLLPLGVSVGILSAMRATLRALLFLLVLGVAANRADAQAKVSRHLTLGNPSRAKPDPAERDNFLVVHDQWAGSWNASKGHPNWVAWHLAAEDLGHADRTDVDFQADPALPADYPRIVRGLYSTTGFDLGHLRPAQDSSRRLDDLKATFTTANCFPQAPALNRGPWGRMEAYRRAQTDYGRELYIVAGPAGTAGRGDKGYRLSIGDDKRQVNVPALCWSVWIEIADRDGNDVARVTRDTVCYAVIFRNDTTCPRNWRDARTTVREVEELTGFDFFDELPADVQRAIETQRPAIDPIDEGE